MCFCYLSNTDKKHTAKKSFSKKAYRLLVNTSNLFLLYICILAFSYTLLSPPWHWPGPGATLHRYGVDSVNDCELASLTEESFTTPQKTTKLSESSSSSPSPRKLPTPPARAEQKSFVCEVCRNVISKSTGISDSLINFSSFPKSNELDTNLNVVLNDLHYKIERVGEQISAIESSIFNHNAIIRDLQGEFSSFTNKFNTLTSKLSKLKKVSPLSPK